MPFGQIVKKLLANVKFCVISSEGHVGWLYWNNKCKLAKFVTLWKTVGQISKRQNIFGQIDFWIKTRTWIKLCLKILVRKNHGPGKITVQEITKFSKSAILSKWRFIKVYFWRSKKHPHEKWRRTVSELIQTDKQASRTSDFL